MKSGAVRKEEVYDIPQEQTLADIIRDCFEEADDDAPKASRILEARAKKDRRLYNLLTEPVLARACWDAIQKHCQRERRRIIHYINPEKEGQARIQQLADANEKSWMEMRLPLPGYPKIGDATREEVEEASLVYLKMAKTNQIMGSWLSQVASHMKGHKILRKQMSEQELKDLYECSSMEE